MESAHLKTGIRSRKRADWYRKNGSVIPRLSEADGSGVGGYAGTAESGADLTHAFVVAEPRTELAARRIRFLRERHAIVVQRLGQSFARGLGIVQPVALVRELERNLARRPVVLGRCEGRQCLLEGGGQRRLRVGGRGLDRSERERQHGQ